MVQMVKKKINSNNKFRGALYNDIAKYSNFKASI